MDVRFRRRRGQESAAPAAVGAALGAVVGATLGDAARMTVPPKFDPTSHNFGIHGALAGAVWGTLLGILVMKIRKRAPIQVAAAVCILLLAAALTIFDPR
jgi:uncharacterized membrane protein YfcA